MKESVTYQLTLEEGRREGLTAGLTAGRREGRQEALVRLRQVLLRLGREILGKPTGKVQKAIEAIEDVDQLAQLGERLPDAKNWQELLQTHAQSAKRKKEAE